MVVKVAVKLGRLRRLHLIGEPNSSWQLAQLELHPHRSVRSSNEQEFFDVSNSAEEFCVFFPEQFVVPIAFAAPAHISLSAAAAARFESGIWRRRCD